VRSATFKRAKQFENEIGNFEYISVPPNYYSIGVTQQNVDNEYTYLLATPEKALCDLILATRNFRLQSIKAIQVFLEEDLRIDLFSWQNVDTEIIRQCVDAGKKKMELTHLMNFCLKRFS
jgi:phage terminase large subunit-like protein